jgi:hypothetical protein
MEEPTNRTRIYRYARELATLVVNRVRVDDPKTMKALSVEYEKMYEIMDRLCDIAKDANG